MKTINLLLVFCTLCVFIVPTIQYGTIFTDFISTPVEFTDITETYISGIKSKEASAKTAVVETISATNPDGFYVNSPGPLKATAGQNVEITSAQTVQFGSDSTESTSLSSAGSLYSKNDRTDVDADDITLSTGDTLSLTSGGTLNVQGNNIDIYSDGDGTFGGRDITVTSATFSNIEANGNLLLNSTYHSSFITQFGDIDVYTSDRTIFDANFVNIKSSLGVDINSDNNININAYAVLEMQGAQFAQVHAVQDISINVQNGDFDVYAAATVAVASEEDLTFTALYNFNIHSLGDSESIVQLNARNGLLTLTAENSLKLGTFVNSYDVDLISAGSLASFSSSTAFFADNYISNVAGNDIDYDIDEVINLLGLDFEAQIKQDINIDSDLGDITLTTLGSLIGEARNLAILSINDINVNAVEVSFIQGAPAILSRNEPSNFFFNTQSLIGNTVNAQFDTAGNLIIGGKSIDFNGNTVSIRSSEGSHTIDFFSQNTTTLNAGDDLRFFGSRIILNCQLDYIASANAINILSSSDLLSSLQSLFDSNFNSVFTSISTSDLLEIFNPGGRQMYTMTDSFVLNTYDFALTAIDSVYFNSTEQIAVGAREYINMESVDGSVFNSDSVFVHASQTGSLFAENFFSNVTTATFNAGDTLYFTANLPSDSLTFSSTKTTFTASTEFESGQYLTINTASSSFTGNTLLIDGYDQVGVETGDFNANAASSIIVSSDGSLTVNSASLFSNSVTKTIFLGDDDGYFQANSITYSARGSGTQFAEDYIEIIGSSTILISSANANEITSNDVNFISSNVNTVTANGAFTITTDSASYTAPTNSLKTTSGGINLFSNDNTIRASNVNTFTASAGTFGVSSSDIWLLGESFTGNSSTQFYNIGSFGSFLSDDQITFNVKNGISASSQALNFVFPLDGTLHFSGGATSFLGTGSSAFNFRSKGDTLINAPGTMSYTAGSFVLFDSFIANYAFTTSITLTTTVTRPSSINFSAAEGEVNFETTNWSVRANTNSYLASRDVNFRGNIVFDSEKSTSQTFDATPYSLAITDPIGIWAETVHEDSHIVFDNQAGNVNSVAAASTYHGAYTTQSYVSGYAFTSTATNGPTTFTVGGNHRLHTSTGATFTSTNDYSLTGKDLVYIESGDHITVAETLAITNSNQVLFNINAGNNLLVSTSGDGILLIGSDAGMTYTTTSFQNWVVTHNTLSTSTKSTYKSTQSDIVTTTSAGAISYDYSAYTGGAGVNVTFNSGHDSFFTGLDYTYNAGLDVVSKSIDGFLDFQANITTFTASTGQLSIDSQGVRTVPRDGVFFTSNDIEVVTTGAGSAVNLYARRSVTFGEFTRPVVSFYGGGSPTQNGFTLNSDGSIKLTSSADTSFNAKGNADITTSQAAVFSSGGPLTIHTDGTNPSPAASIYATSNNGNIHFLSQQDSTWTTNNQFSANAAGSIQFTTLRSATFTASVDVQESANSLALTFDNSYLSTSSGLTSIDGHTSFAITTSEFGDVSFTGNSNSFATGTAFAITSYGDDAKFQFKAKTATISTTKSSSNINFDSAGSLFTSSGALTLNAKNSYSVSSQTTVNQQPAEGGIFHQNPEDGGIFYISKGALTLTATDTIDISSTRDAHILADTDISFSSSGDLVFLSGWDQEWDFNTSPLQSPLSFLATGTITMDNTPGNGGDITFTSPGISDILFFDVTSTTGSIVLNIGNNFVSHATDGLQIRSTGTDFKDSYGLRFQAEGPSADLEFFASGNTYFSALVNTRFDASDNLDVFGGIGMSLIAQGVNANDQGVIFGAALGDISFVASQSPVSFIGNQIDVVGNGTDINNGRIHLTANGIDKSSSYGINMQFDASVLAIGSVSGNVNVYAGQSIQINLDDVGAHALFGYQRNTFEELFSIFRNYYPPYQPYDPSKFINVPLQSRTNVFSHGPNADIVFETQNTEDGIGQFVAYAGTIEPYQFSELNAPSQLQLVAYGNDNVTGDITFLLEGGITFRGLDRSNRVFNPINNPIVESDCLFLANDESSSIAIVTTKDAVFSNIDITTSELTLNAENKLNIRSTDRNGDSTVLIESGSPGSNQLGKIAVSTTGNSWGPGTALPGIELRSYRSEIDIDAGDFGDVIHHALRNMNVEADNGFDYSAPSIFFQSGFFRATSTEGNIRMGFQNIFATASTIASVQTSFGPNNNFGDDITFRARIMTIQGTNIQIYSENNVYFNFDASAYLAADVVTIEGTLTIPMIDDEIIIGAACTRPSQPNVRSIFIARSPPYDARTVTATPDQYDIDLDDVYQGLGLRLCVCSNRNTGTFRYECMSLSQFGN